MGVKIVLNHRVDDLLAEKRQGDFDAIFVAVLAPINSALISSRDASRIADMVWFPQGCGIGQRPKLGQRVAIYGGGNTAMDAADYYSAWAHER